MQVNSDLTTLDEFLSMPVGDSVTMETLGTYKQVMDRLSENYSQTKSLGELQLQVERHSTCKFVLSCVTYVHNYMCLRLHHHVSHPDTPSHSP